MPEPLAVERFATRSFLTFRLDQRLYALRAEEVAEVVIMPAIARVPLSPPALLGIANLRGSVVPIVSLRGLLGRTESALDSKAKVIVLNVGAPIAVVVDTTDGLVTVDADRIEEREAELSAEAGELLSGAFQVDAERGVARVLDIERLLNGALVQRARPQRRASGIVAPAKQEQSAANAEQFDMLVSFDVAGQEFALDLEAVQEVLPVHKSLTPMPRAEALVLGVTSLGERLLPLFSLRGLLGFPSSPDKGGREKVVVIEVAGAQVGLVADGARSVIAAKSSRIDPVPAILAARSKGEASIHAIYRAEGGSRLVSILKPEKLFREDMMQRLDQARGTNARQRPQEDAVQQVRDEELQFLVFRLGKDEFALPIATVDEVAQMPARMTRVPKTPKFLDGVTNLHGDVLPVVDLRRRFDMPAFERPQARRLLVLKTPQYRAGVLVDSVSDVLRIPANAVGPAPDLTEQTARLVRGVINLEDAGRIVLLLDPMELLTPAEQGRLRAFQKTGQADA